MNPFDQFAGTLQAALPPQQQLPDGASVSSTVTSAQQPGGGQPQQQQQQPPQFNLMAQPAQEKKPIMNAPGLGGHQHQQGGMLMYGGPPQGGLGTGGAMGMQGGMYGQQPPQPSSLPPGQQMMLPSQSTMGSLGMGAATMNGSMGGSPLTPMQQLAGGGPPGASPAMTGALVPSSAPSNPYALGPSPAAAANPFGPPVLGAPPPQTPNAIPLGASAPALGAPPHQPPGQQHLLEKAVVPALPTAAPRPSAAPAIDSFAVEPARTQMVADLWGATPPDPLAPAALPLAEQAGPAHPGVLVSSTAPPGNDPFGIFGGGVGGARPSSAASVAPRSAVGGPPSVHPSMGIVAPVASEPPTASDDPWAEMGFGSVRSAPSAEVEPAPRRAPALSGPVPGEDDVLFNSALQPTRDDDQGAKGSKASEEPKPSAAPKRKKGELPPGGEWYDAKIFTPTLGVMFFKPKELVDSLFLQTDRKLVDALDERPVVAFIVEGSSARSAGVELGHVLLKVNGIDVKNPKEASRLIKEGPRPLPLLFYVPETSVVVAEGEHMVKYNTKETGAPNSAKDWKPKYVVIGGIIAQPWMMNMYRSKSEYDIAVIETQARRPVSVKVKQFSLQGARIQNDWQGPQMVKYKNKLHPWKYIVVLPVSRNPIKIASPNLSQLRPVHEGIRRVLQAQQRDRGGGGGHNRAGPIPRGSENYAGSSGGGGGGGYDSREREHGPSRNGRNASPSAYYGGRTRGSQLGF